MSEGDSITRRQWLSTAIRAVAGAALLTTVARRADALHSAKPTSIVIYKDPDCGCCKAWVAHLRANEFAPDAKDRSDMDALKDSLGVPAALRSCHTAVAGRYVIEGHVPAADIKRLLASGQKDVAGIAVPGMPAGSPGMEVPGRAAHRYDVVAFSAAGKTRIFARH